MKLRNLFFSIVLAFVTVNAHAQYVTNFYLTDLDNETLKERILLESIFIRYYLLKIYPETVKNLTEEKTQLIADAKSVGIARASSHRTIDELFKSNYDI